MSDGMNDCAAPLPEPTHGRPVCEDCEEPIRKGQRRTRCKRCGLLVCAWCDHHIHRPERDAAAIAAVRGGGTGTEGGK